MSVDKLVDSTQLDADLTSVANAIRTKGGTSASLDFPADFVSAIAAIPSGGGGYSINDIVTGNISGAIIITAGSITHGDFHGTGITSISAPNATSMILSDDYNKAFCKDCTSLVSLSMPSVISIKGARYAFQNTRITELNLPEVTEFSYNNNFMYGNTALTQVSMPKVTNAQTITSAFEGCTSLHTVVIGGSDRPNGDAVFRGCTSLRNVKYYGATDVGGYTFRNCTALEKIALPKSTIVGPYCFGGCTSLTDADLLASTRIDQNCFNGSGLSILVLRKASVVTLNNINAFNGTPFASGGTGGTLYVPNALISSYQSASNWSTILGYTNNQIKSIESTHTDPNAPIDLTLYYADGTLIPT